MNTALLPTRPLGNSGIRLSALGLGTVKIGRNQGVKYPQSFDLPDDKAVQKLLALAQSLGINWLDTAPAYGSSENRLGTLIRRNEWYIASKVGENFHNNQSSFDFSAAAVKQSIDNSLRRLRSEHIDLINIHSDGNDLAILHQSDCLAALEQAKQAGKIRAIGISCKTGAGAQAWLPYVDALMLELNPEHRKMTSVIKQADAQNVGILIKKGFGSGHLLAQYSLQNLADFLFQHPITALISGTINPDHLRANCAAVSRASHAASL